MKVVIFFAASSLLTIAVTLFAGYRWRSQNPDHP